MPPTNMHTRINIFRKNHALFTKDYTQRCLLNMGISAILEKISKSEPLVLQDVIHLLKTSDTTTLYAAADKIRKRYMGDAIYLRGIIEFSNHCKKNCYYCGIQRTNTDVTRYRIPDEEIIETCKHIEKRGQTTVVLQSGEDAFYTKEKLGTLIAAIRKETNLAITISVGERDEETYRYWKEMGMDRYLLRFETSDKELFAQCHPDDNLKIRLACLTTLQRIGVQTGSGILIGLPNETYEQLANDILFCTNLTLDMIGVGPFIPHERTPFANTHNPFDKEVYFKVIAILRLLNPDAHIPSTTAFDAIDPNGRNLLLQRGANVFMPNATPKKYRKDYLLYPGKPCVDESADDCSQCVAARILSIGRKIGEGPGHSIKTDTQNKLPTK